MVSLCSVSIKDGMFKRLELYVLAYIESMDDRHNISFTIFGKIKKLP